MLTLIKQGLQKVIGKKDAPKPLASTQASKESEGQKAEPQRVKMLGGLLKKFGAWVKPSVGKDPDDVNKSIDAGKDLTKVTNSQQWNEIENLDLSEQHTTPRNFEAPKNLKKLRLNLVAVNDKEKGIANDPAFLNKLPAEAINVEIVTNRKQIFAYLQNKPEKLTASMAHVITGQTLDLQGLSDEAIFKSLYRLEKKLGPDQLDKIDIEVKNILLKKLERSHDKRIWKQTLKLEKLLKNTEHEDKIIQVEQVKPSKERTQKALRKELNTIENKVFQAISENQVIGGEDSLLKISKDILDLNLHHIKTRATSGTPRDRAKAREAIIDSYKDLFKCIKDQESQNKLMAIAQESLVHLETSFEISGDKKAKDYERITQEHLGDTNKLFFATALLNKHSGIHSISQNHFLSRIKT